MPTDLTETAIMNMALDLLIEESIDDTSDDRPVARWLARNYETVRDALLRQHPWNFALKRDSLAADPTAPAFEWAYRYLLPSDCLRLLPLTVAGDMNGSPIWHVVEGLYLLTDEPAPLKVKYIARIENPGLFDPNFVNALVHILANKAAHWMTGKAGFAEKLRDPTREAIFNAQLLDSLEGSAASPADYDIIAARQ